jgi:hypothetical protein
VYLPTTITLWNLKLKVHQLFTHLIHIGKEHIVKLSNRQDIPEVHERHSEDYKHPDPMQAAYEALCRLREALTEALEDAVEGSVGHQALTSSLQRVEEAVREHEDPYWTEGPGGAARALRPVQAVQPVSGAGKDGTP